MFKPINQIGSVKFGVVSAVSLAVLVYLTGSPNWRSLRLPVSWRGPLFFSICGLGDNANSHEIGRRWKLKWKAVCTPKFRAEGASIVCR